MLPEVIDELYQYLSPAEFQLVIRLGRYVAFNTCYLTQDGKEDGTFCTTSWMADDLGYNYDNLKRLINRLFKKGILAITKVSKPNGRDVQKVYTMNPFVCRKGNNVDLTAIDLFDGAWHPNRMPEMKVHYRETEKFDHRFDNKKIIVMPRKNGTDD